MTATPSRLEFATLAVLALSAGTACPLVPEPYTVRLASPQEMLPAPRFKVSQHKKARPQFYHLSVTERDGDPTYLWNAMFPGGYYEADELTYGVTPATWVSQTGPKPLEPGKKYTLRVGGDGDGYCRFRVDEAGRVQEDD